MAESPAGTRCTAAGSGFCVGEGQMEALQRLQGPSPAETQYIPLVPGDAQACQVYGCHCEPVLGPPQRGTLCGERSPKGAWRTLGRRGVAIRNSCGSTKRKAILCANTKPTTNSPKQQQICQVSLRGNGLPRRFAPRNDMQKTDTRLGLQGRLAQWHP